MPSRWYGQQVSWSRGRIMSSACATMLIVAAGSRFPEVKTPDRIFRPRRESLWGTATTAAAAAAAAEALGRVAGMIKKAAYRSSGRRVRGEHDKIPSIKKELAPDLPLDALRNTDVRVDPWSAPACALPNALRIRPANARTSGAHASRSDAPSYEGLGPCTPPPDRHVLGTRMSGTSRRRTESPSWFETQALTGTCPSTP